MNFMLVICAALCVLMLGWVFKPLRTPRAFYALAFLCAMSTLGIYLFLGNPDMPAQTVSKDEVASRREFMFQEIQFLTRIEKNPKDADAMIRLAAIQVLQNRASLETTQLLDRADAILPGDRRIKFIRTMIKYPSPSMPDMTEEDVNPEATETKKP